ncbi:hypothetical protein [Burkholderia sp. Ac-20365]|uniref:hypothetical protein n=1 Tax=Burkholderia sp. Ac-20365 TaxID=2703897 RepID=UPI00197B813E|nr:hypothetical protein [Burkholderia sp. Ac-20365]MBN3760739.1 hypothetical protein [Burkholderia sp. Ac-20365]
MKVTDIRFRDIVFAETAEIAQLRNRISQLDRIKANRAALSASEDDEYLRVGSILATLEAFPEDEVCDPRFVAMRDLFNRSMASSPKQPQPCILGVKLANHAGGKLRSEPGANAASLGEDQIVMASLTLGLSMVDQTPPPRVLTREVKGAQSRIISDVAAPEYAEFSRGFFAAFGEAQSMFELAKLVLPLLSREGDTLLDDRTPGSVDAAEFARVMRALREKGVTSVKEQQLRRRINECLNQIQFVGEDGPVTEMGIDLPDLDQATDADIVPENVRLMGPMICAAMFDELKAFQVVDKLVELSQQGMLPIGSGPAGKLLYRYWKDAPNRMSEAERKNFYSMTMGIPGGESSGMVNRDFNDLWLRFVSSVSSFIRQSEVDKLLRASVPNTVSQQQVRKAARDLAVNLSLHGYGMAYYAALDLQAQIRFMITLLSDEDIRSAYGARDMWQVVDQVATLELGGARTSSRYRTLATCGAIITAWLSNNVQRIMRSTVQIIDMDCVRAPSERPSGQKATTTPSDYDLVNACELWLADTATPDTRVDEMAQPREAPVMTSRPVQIPNIAREMLDGAGIGMGMGMNLSGMRH